MRILILISLLALTICCGCTVPYFRSIQGTSVTAGISLPSESNAELQFMSYLSGEKIQIKEKSNVSYSYTHTATNNYFFGMIKTEEFRNGKIKIEDENRRREEQNRE